MTYRQDDMFNDLTLYFYEKIIADYKKFTAELVSPVAGRNKALNLAINSATSLFHFIEHFPELQKTRVEIATIYPDYNLAGDIANVSKHKTLTRGKPQISDANDVYEKIVQIEFQDDQGTYTYAEKRVCAKLANGEERDVYGILTSVINMWVDELQTLGLASNLEHFNLRQIGIPTREEANKSCKKIEFTSGLGTTINYQMMRYNYETNIIEPVNLTGKDITWSCYKPTEHSLEMAIKHSKENEDIKFSMDLTEDEYKKFKDLNTEEEKETFTINLAVARGHISIQRE